MSKEKIGVILTKRVTWIVVAVLVILAVMALIIGVITAEVETPAPTEVDRSTEQVTIQPIETEIQTEETHPSEEVTEPSTEPTQETAPATVPIVTPTLPMPTTPPKTVIKLPYTIPGTTLVIQKVANYTGIYLEDGSNSDVTDVAMMLLYNTGSEAIEFADLVLHYDDKTLEFKVSALPAGAKIAVQELNGQSCAFGDLTSCGIDIATTPVMELSENKVNVVDNGNNTLTVTNLTDQDIPTVRIFYKYYLEDEDAYIGGITFNAAIYDLKAGESMVLMPKRFASKGSRIIMVRIYDTVA